MMVRILEFSQRYAWKALLGSAGLFLVFAWLPNGLRWPVRILFFAALILAVAGLFRKLRHAPRNPKHVVFTAIALMLGGLLIYGFLEGVSLFYLRSDPNRNTNPLVLTEAQRSSIERLVQGEPEYTAFDPVLGWSILKNGASADGRYQANSAGFRASREYSATKRDEITRVTCFGDSYTHGNSVKNDETWQHYAESHLPDWEFLNFGVGAFGMTQTYLRYREVRDQFETDFVVIGCMTDNIRRTVNVYYPFRLSRLDATTFALAKPWASLDPGGELKFHPNPLPSLEAYEAFFASPEKKMRQMAQQDLLFEKAPPTPLLTVATEKIAEADFDFFSDRFYGLIDRDPPRDEIKRTKGKPSPFDPDTEIFRINSQLFLEFAAEVEADGSIPVILWFPSPKDVDRYNERRSRIYQSFLQFFDDNGLEYLDSLDWIAETYGGTEFGISPEEIFHEGHYAPPVNQLIGVRLGDFLEERVR